MVAGLQGYMANPVPTLCNHVTRCNSCNFFWPVLPHQLIEQRLQQAVQAVLPDADVASVLVRPCPDPKFGDYQTNALMSLAKARKLNPRQLAADVVAKLDVGECCEQVEIAGAGFLNFRLKPATLTRTLQSAARGEHLFLRKTAHPRTVVVDFSSPNVAKPMHVGHIRSTILGDCLARTLRLLGHNVITDNHLGDWGTQFGMLLVGWKRDLDAAALKTDPIAEMERLYRWISAECKANPGTLEAARQELVKLQSGDEENLRIWQEMIALSRVQFDTIYQRLGVKFDHTLGESFYHPRLQPLVEELCAKGIARESEGALAVFFEDIPQIEGTPRLDPKERRRLQLHHHGPRHPGLSPGNLAPGRDHLCHRRPPAAPFPAALRRVPPVASRGQNEAGPRLVWLHPGRRRQAFQNPLRRHRQTGRPAG